MLQLCLGLHTGVEQGKIPANLIDAMCVAGRNGWDSRALRDLGGQPLFVGSHVHAMSLNGNDLQRYECLVEAQTSPCWMRRYADPSQFCHARDYLVWGLPRNEKAGMLWFETVDQKIAPARGTLEPGQKDEPDVSGLLYQIV